MVPPARASTSFTCAIRSIVRRCRASSESVSDPNAPFITPAEDRSVVMPGCAAMSTVGAAKSLTSATRCSVLLAPEVGGASNRPHCTTASPSAFVLTTPSVAVPSASALSVTIRFAAVPVNTVDAAMLNGAPTSAGVVREEPATSYVRFFDRTVRFSIVRSISTRPE